jgi:hypothetical protein
MVNRSKSREPRPKLGTGIILILWSAFNFTWDYLVVTKGEFRIGRTGTWIRPETHPGWFWMAVVLCFIVGLAVGGIGVSHLRGWWRARRAGG